MDLRKQGIVRAESGIIEKQGIYFHTASAFAQRYLYYGLWGSEYVCTEPYQVERGGFQAFLFFYIKEGALQFSYREQEFTAKAGDVVLLDCHYPHRYFAVGAVRFSWFHFQGSASGAYCKELWQNGGAYFPNTSDLEQDFDQMLHLLTQGTEADDQISVLIHHMLALLNSRLNLQGKREHPLSPQITRAKKWFEEHFTESISIEDAADLIDLSRYHFSRRFQREVGTSPQAYLMELRMTFAKQRLAESSDSVEQIAFDCAFCSSSNFIRAFKKSTGMTPHQFRQITD